MLNHVCAGASIARYAKGIDATTAPQTSHSNLLRRSDAAVWNAHQPVRRRKKGAASNVVFTAAPAASPARNIRLFVGLASSTASHADKLKNMHNAYGCASSPDCGTIR